MTLIYFALVLICYFYLLNKIKDKPDEWRINKERERLEQDEGENATIQE